jgi:hypothetical protein
MLSSSSDLMSKSVDESSNKVRAHRPANIWHTDWFWLALLFCVKLATDLVFWKYQAGELSLDNIDYLDHARQYFNAKDAVSFYQVFLTSFGRLRSPFQSWLIYTGKLAFPHLSFGTVAYIIQIFALLLLAVASLAIAKRIVQLRNADWNFSCTIIILSGIFFAPLSIGLTRGTLVELLLTACMFLFIVICSSLARTPTATSVCLLNLIFAVGVLTKFTYPLYIAVPLIAIVIMSVGRKEYSAVFFSILFQSLVQVGFCYNIVNFVPMLNNARLQANGATYGYQVSILREIAVSGLGVPCFVLFLFIVALTLKSGNLARVRSLLWSKTDGRAALLLFFGTGARQEVLILSISAINLILLFFIHLHSANQMVRFFYFSVIAIVIFTAILFATLRLRPRTKTFTALAFCATNFAVCLLFSFPTAATACSYHVLTTIFNIDCFSAEPVDGTMYAPRIANYHVFEIVHLLQRRISSGSKVLLINPNEFFDHQSFYYHLRDAAAQQGFYFDIVSIGPTELNSHAEGPWANIKAIIFKDFTTDQYETLVLNGAAPLKLSAHDAAEYNRLISLKLSQIGAQQIYRRSNAEGVVSVYLVK